MNASLPQLPKIELSLVPDAIRPAIEAVLALAGELIKENQLLRGKLDALIRHHFGGQKSESISSGQLELMLQGFTQALAAATPATPPTKEPRERKAQPKSPVRTGVPDHLPVRSTQVLIPAEVQAHPEQFRQIDSDTTRILDYEPGRFVCEVIIRQRYVRKEPATAPAHEPEVLASPLPNRLIEKGLPGPGLLSHVILNRFNLQLPFYRQQKNFAEQHGVSLSRQTMVGWIEELSGWVEPILVQMKLELFTSRYLQMDETPIRYLDRDEPGKSQKGFFWVFGRPGGNVIFEWHTSRSREAPREFLEGYQGRLQCDGYGVYPSLAKEKPGLELYFCVAHWRRKFIEAKDEDRRSAWFLLQLRHLYGVERRLRDQGAGPALREAVRASEARPIWERLKKAMAIYEPKVLPESRMGKALAYGKKLWEGMLRHVGDGQAEIDNNWVENQIRPTAVGKKNFLFIGHPDAGGRSAAFYTILGTCRSLGINPAEYLTALLEKLPDMTTSEVKDWTPAAWFKKNPRARAAMPA